MSVALGIDLGTTHSVAAIATPTGVEFILGARGERVHPLAIRTVGGFTERRPDNNAPIPIERTRSFTISRDHQTLAEIDCCRGEGRRYLENEPIGTLRLDGLPPRPRGDLKIEVQFRVDADGILHVRASDRGSGKRQEAHLHVLGAPVQGP